MITVAALLGSLLTGPLALSAAEDQPGDAVTANAKAKPYPLKTCIVSDEKLDGGMGKPYVFVQDGQEIKLCCKSCLKDFKKDTAKYMKKLTDAQATAPAHDHSAHQH